MHITLLAFSVPANSQTYLTEIEEKWANSSIYLLGIAQYMPDSLYNYKPTPDQMTFGEQLIHTGNNMIRLAGNQLGYKDEPKPTLPPNNAGPDKIRAFLKSSFAFAGKAIKKETTTSLDTETDFFAGSKTHRQIINLMNDHVTHHRGQLIVYLRLNGISPGRYVGW